MAAQRPWDAVGGCARECAAQRRSSQAAGTTANALFFVRRLMYQLVNVEGESCLHAPLNCSCWHLSGTELTRHTTRSAARMRHLHGKNGHVIEKTLQHWHCSDSVSRLHTVMQVGHCWFLLHALVEPGEGPACTEEVDQAHDEHTQEA